MGLLLLQHAEAPSLDHSSVHNSTLTWTTAWARKSSAAAVPRVKLTKTRKAEIPFEIGLENECYAMRIVSVHIDHVK